MTLAPMTGPYVSVTVPEIRTVCAKAAVVRNKTVKKAKNLLFIGWIELVKKLSYR